MKLKKTRKERKCYECKSLKIKEIYKKSIALGEKVKYGESEILMV